MTLSRRDLLKRSAQVGLGVAVVGHTNLFTAIAAGAATGGTKGPGSLLDDPAGLLDLPPGFHYDVISRASDGPTARPGRFDGTGSFAVGGVTFLVRNHEQGSSGPTCARPDVPTYDATVRGGTSTVRLGHRNAVTQELVSLGGTYNNCAGGVTPWGTWLTCEETEITNVVGSPGYPASTASAPNPFRPAKPHGFVFEVDPVGGGDPRPIEQLGRFAHEAAVVDPATGVVYLTEDAAAPFGLVYRYVPTTAASRFGELHSTAGPLEAMRCSRQGQHVANLHGFSQVGTTLDVEWTAVPDRTAATVSVRKQLADSQVTRSQKFEGAWFADGKAYLVVSFSHPPAGSGAPAHDGQVWSYDPTARTLTLEVFYALNADPAGAGADLPDGPDNITVAPGGGLFLAEDGEGVQHLLAVSRTGETQLFARNASNDSEFTGVVFSPDGRTLFANIQEPGLTFAITGPFERMA